MRDSIDICQVKSYRGFLRFIQLFLCLVATYPEQQIILSPLYRSNHHLPPIMLTPSLFSLRVSWRRVGFLPTSSRERVSRLPPKAPTLSKSVTPIRIRSLLFLLTLLLEHWHQLIRSGKKVHAGPAPGYLK